MLGELVTRVLVLVVGYAYPAYECFKVLEKRRVDIEQLHFWCQYWTIVGTVTVLENFDAYFVSWLPMYNESKLAFFIYLWSPKTKGAAYVYQSLLRPYVLKHQPEIERKVRQVAATCGDVLKFYTKSVSDSFVSRSPSFMRPSPPSPADTYGYDRDPDQYQDVPWNPFISPPGMMDAASTEETIAARSWWPRRRRGHR